MVTPTEDFELLGRWHQMHHPRVFVYSPCYDIFTSDRARYREDYDIEFINGEFAYSDNSSGYENCLDSLSNKVFRIKHGNHFNE